MKSSRNSRARQMAILKHLKNSGRALVDELAEQFETTPQTIRKDLKVLADDSHIIRFHGGAALVVGTEYTSFETRADIAKLEKDVIGRRVAVEIPNNSSIIINSGTTTLATAVNLNNHVGLKVVTDSVWMANILRKNSGNEVMVPGGIVRSSDGAIYGDSAIEFVRQFRADVAIIGAAAIASDGSLLDYDLHEASLTRAIIASARHVILAADSKKFGRMAPFCFGQLEQIDTLATDDACSAELRQLCEDNGVGLLA